MATTEDIEREGRLRAWQVRIDDEVFVVISSPLGPGVELGALTGAERDVVRQILRGDSNKQIAACRGTAVRTVANQIAAIFAKLGIASRAELAAGVAKRRAR